MIRIAVCDDELKICSMMEEYVIEACKDAKVKVDIVLYDEGETLCEALRAGERFSLIFLDIELRGINGVSIGSVIREELEDNTMQIAYISGKESYAMQLFESRPINFIVKPITYEQVVEVIGKTISLMNAMSKKFVYKLKQDMHFIEFRDIIYFKSNNRKVLIITKYGTQEFYGKLDKISNQLPKEEFLYIHKSYIVNTSYIATFEYENVKMVTGEVLPIAQSRRKKIRMEQARIANGENK